MGKKTLHSHSTKSGREKKGDDEFPCNIGDIFQGRTVNLPKRNENQNRNKHGI